MQIQFENPQSSMSFRMALARKSFSLHTSETSSSTVVTDTIRKIDYENAWQALRHSYKFNRCHWAAEADLVTVRLLPEAVGTFCLQHTSGETYQNFSCSVEMETATKVFAEFQPKKQLYQLGSESG